MILRTAERERTPTHAQTIRYTPREEVLYWVLDQVRRGTGMLATAMTCGEVVAVEITMEGVQSVANKTVGEENK